MSDVNDTLGLLDLPSRAVSAVRDMLGLIGVEPPAPLVQAVVLAVALALLVVFVRMARSAEGPPGLAAASVGAIVCAAVVVAIPWTWVDRALNPPTGQVRGALGAPPPPGAEVHLLDHAGRAFGDGYVDAVSGDFAANYDPGADEPPRALAVTAEGCEDRRVPLGRRQLQFGEPIAVRLDCGGNPG